MRIVIDIERVVFEGVLTSPADGRRAGAALKTALEGLLSAGGIPSEIGVAGLSSNSVIESVAIGRSEPSDVVGRRIADAVHVAISKAISERVSAAAGKH